MSRTKKKQAAGSKSAKVKSELRTPDASATPAPGVPDEVLQWWAQAQTLEQQGQVPQALAAYGQLTQQAPEFAAGWHKLGLLAFATGSAQQALQALARAAELAPQEALFVKNWGEVSRRCGLAQQAVDLGLRACALAPDDADARYNAALACSDLQRLDEALALYREALALRPSHGMAWNNLGAALEQQGRMDEAQQAYAEAVRLNPQHAEALNNLGAVYSELGRMDEAREAYAQAVQARPDFVEAHYNLSSLKTYVPGDAHLQALREAAQRQGDLPVPTRIRYNFALAKALDDVGESGPAFARYALANGLQHALLPVDEVLADQVVAHVEQAFTADFFAAREGWGDAQATPVFIVGMPRSGTSLLEQVLATHDSVFGAGELSFFNNEVLQCAGALGEAGFVQRVQALTREQVQGLAAAYLAQSQALAGGQRFVVDKMPANFFYLGLIRLAFPNARVIHAMRDPMDSCFSCLTKLFTRTMEFTYDQGVLGRYFARYMRVMAHWQAVLTPGFVLDLPYETLVADFEAQARRVLDFVGLPWDARVLDFHKTARHVRTASVMQVRQPLYSSSVGRWQRFAPLLKPLFDEVKAWRTPEQNAQAEAAFDASNPAVADLLAQYAQEQQRIAQEGPAPLALNAEQQAAQQTAQQLAQQLAQQVTALQGQGAHEQVLALLQQHAPLVQASAVLLHLLGISFYRLDRFEQARAAYEAALALQPGFANAYNSLGFVLQDMNLMVPAREAFAQAVALAPDFAMARLNLSLAQLKLAEFEQGWENYEARWAGSAEASQPGYGRPSLPLPQWNGETGTQGQSILVVTEQGFGDTFQFARYLRGLQGRFARVGFACSEPTRRLLEWTFGHDVVLMTRMPTDLQVWDWHVPLMSLPRAFGTRLDSIPPAQPFFEVPQAAQAYWAARLAQAAPGRLRVGLSWSGRKSHQYDARRSMALETLWPLLRHPSITWVSLQKWNLEDAPPQLPPEAHWLDWTADLGDFADSAALASQLDLVVSIDSAAVHLAASLGVPVWMLNRFDSEWRWLTGRKDSPWYPTLQIFQQPSFGDWDSVVAQVGAALDALVLAQPSPRTQSLAQPALPPAAPQATPQAAQPAAVQAPPQGLSVLQALAQAGQWQQSGQLGQAQALLQQVLAQQPPLPQQAQALHLLGVVLYQGGQAAQGIAHIEQAAALVPDNAFFLSNLTEMLRQQGRVQEAVQAGERAVAQDPSLVLAQTNLGVALFDEGRLDEAEQVHLRALALAPQALQSLNNLGSIERARRRRHAAVGWYRKVLEIAPHHVEALGNLGAVLVELDRAQEAMPVLEQGLALAPQSAELLNNLGLACLKLERLESARSLFERTLALRPDYPEALTGLASALNRLELSEQAQALLERALVLAPHKVDSWCQLGAVLTERGRAAEAAQAYERALQLETDSIDALNGLAHLHLEGGRLDEAQSLAHQALAIDPDSLDGRFLMTQIRKVRPDDGQAQALERILEGADALSETKRVSLHYALGKCFDDTQDYDRAFGHFLQGARIKRGQLAYDPAEDDRLTQDIIETFDAELLQRLSGAGDASAAPVFVLGMPRSGTTLTEQILASHPQVHGAGELTDLAEVVQAAQQPYPSLMRDLSHQALTQMGAEYVRRLRLHNAQATHITDKMPANYFFVGMIGLMLPKAKVVHVRRNPVDTCVSCFTRLFNRHQDATYDLAELGRHYVNYHRLMRHWRQVLPQGAFYEVDYEALVADLEPQARGLIAHVGLPWDEACLKFHENKRAIRTASVTQVRQPLYASSVARWRHYERFLQPLLDELCKEPEIERMVRGD